MVRATANPERLITVRQLSTVLNLKPQGINNRIRKSGLPVLKTGEARTCSYRLTVDQATAIFGATNPDGLRRALLSMP